MAKSKSITVETATDKTVGRTQISPHNCTSKFQDKRYGGGKRVFNIGKSKLTCTVCGGTK